MSKSRVQIERVGGLVWTVRSDAPSTGWRGVLEDPEEAFADATRHIKNSRNVTLVRVPATEPGAPKLVLRRLNYGKWRSQLRDFFRRSRAHRALSAALALEMAGLPVARGLAAAGRRRFGWPQVAYYLSTEIEDAKTLNALVRGAVPLAEGLASALATLLGKLHNAGFIHGDLKATNILVGAGNEPWLIDFDGVRRFKIVSRSRAEEELKRFAVGILEAGGTIEDRWVSAFAKDYCRVRGLTDWEEWRHTISGGHSGESGAPRVV